MRTPNDVDPLTIQVVELHKAALYFRAINHPLRQQMLKLLHKKGEMIVTDIYVKLRLPQSVASQHLAVLRKAKLVQTLKEGKNIYYSIDYPRLEKMHSVAGQLLK